MYSTKHFFLLLSCISLCYGCQEDFEHHLQREAKAYTQRHCPKQIEAGTTLDSVTYDMSTRTYKSWHTLHGYLDTPEAHQTAQQHLDLVREQLTRTLIGDTKWETCKEQRINFSYIYRSLSLNKELFRITLTPSDYQR